MRHLVELFTRYAQLNTKVPADAVETVRAVRHPGYLADLLRGRTSCPDPHERQAVLEELDQAERLERVGAVLTNELDVLELDQRIRTKVRAQIDKNQREFYLREQLKAIHDELGGEGGNELAELREKLERRACRTTSWPRCPEGADPAGAHAVGVARRRGRPHLHRLDDHACRGPSAPTTSSTSGWPSGCSTRTTTAWKRSRSASSSSWPCAS